MGGSLNLSMEFHIKFYSYVSDSLSLVLLHQDKQRAIALLEDKTTYDEQYYSGH